MNPDHPPTLMPWTMAYWYAVGRNDERADPDGDHIDPLAFAGHYADLLHDLHHGTRTLLGCIPDVFAEYVAARTPCG